MIVPHGQDVASVLSNLGSGDQVVLKDDIQSIL
jgi:hypothetical protein